MEWTTAKTPLKLSKEDDTKHRIEMPMAIEEFHEWALSTTVFFQTTLYPAFICVLNPLSAGIDFSRQNLTSLDVRF